MPYPGCTGKCLDENELLDYLTNKLSIVSIFEYDAGRMLDGYPAGVEDATLCLAAAERFGIPASAPFYFACDIDTTPGMDEYIADYLYGCIDVLGIHRVGIYGEEEILEYCRNHGVATWFFQTYAWSGGQIWPYRNIYQYLNGQTINGGSVDFDQGEGKNFGQWPVEDDMEETLRLLNEAIVKRFNLIEIASGDYNRMLAGWEACRAAGVITMVDAPPDTWPPVIAVKPPA